MTTPDSLSDLWQKYSDHVTRNLRRLHRDPAAIASFISQMGDYFVAQQYPYHIIAELMARIAELSKSISEAALNTINRDSSQRHLEVPDSPIGISVSLTPRSRTAPSTPRVEARALTVARSKPGSPRETPPASETLEAWNRVYVEFESPEEYYRAIQMIRSVEVHRDKTRSSGGKARKPPIYSRLIGPASGNLPN